MSADPELFKQAATGPSWQAMVGYAGSALGAAAAVCVGLFQRIVKKHDDEIASIKAGIREVSVKLDDKADKAEMNRQRDHIAELFRVSREDKEEILGAIHGLTTTVVTELGKRPTRDEMALYQGKKR